MGIGASGFEWDAGNRAKCRKHGVSQGDIESALRGTIAVFPDPAHSDDEERFKAVGRTAEGRSILVVFTLRARGDQRLIRPISARFMHRKEIDYYEEEIAKAGERSGS